MAEQVLDWGPGFPASQNNDTTTELSLGTRFTVSQSAPALGVQIQIPTTLPTGPNPAFVSIWDTGPNILAFQAFEWADFTGDEGTEQIVYFVDDDNISGHLPDADLAPATTYVAVVQTFERWAGTVAYPFPITTGVITAGASNGWVLVGYGYPANLSGAGYSFGVSPVIQVADTIVGAIDATLAALTADASASQTITATVDATLPAFTATTTVTGDTNVHRPNAGTVSPPDDGTVSVPRVAYP